MKVLIVCPRDFDDYFQLEHALNEFMPYSACEVEIVSGDLGDAVCLIEQYCLSHRLPYTKFLPNWYHDGEHADVYATNRMLDYCEGPRNTCLSFTKGRTKYVNDLTKLAVQRRMSVLKIVE